MKDGRLAGGGPHLCALIIGTESGNPIDLARLLESLS